MLGSHLKSLASSQNRIKIFGGNTMIMYKLKTCFITCVKAQTVARKGGAGDVFDGIGKESFSIERSLPISQTIDLDLQC